MLEGQKQYVVPLYQRRYAWSQLEWRPMWTATVREYAELATGDDDRGHFLGSLVVQQLTGMAHGVQRFHVIDGQQRLTTAFILLNVLRDLSADEHTADQLQNTYLVNPYAAGDYRSKIVLGPEDQPDVERLLGASPDRASGKVGAAYWWFRNQVDLLETKGAVDLPRLAAAVTQRMEVVDIAADERDNAYRIFQTLNSTGKQLTAVDLLRNHFFMLLPTHADEAYRDHWAPMEALLGSHFSQFLWVELVSRGRGKETVPVGRVYGAWQEDLEAFGADEEAVFRALERLHQRAVHFALILRPKDVEHDGLRSAISRLNEWGTPVQLPVMLQIVDRWREKSCSGDEASEAVGWVESFLVRRMLARVPTNNLNRIFTTVAGSLAEERELSLPLRKILSGHGKYWPTDAELAAAVVSEAFYRTQRSTQRQFILRRFEEHAAQPYKPDWGACSFTLEHVLPQQMSPPWYEHLARTESDPLVAHEQLVHTLGNITLTCENPELSNMAFDEKKKYLRADIMRMNKAIVGEPEWGRAQIEARSRELGEVAVQLWAAPLEKTAEPELPQVDLMLNSLSQLPEGRWTSYEDLAELAETAPAIVRAFFLASDAPLDRAEAVLFSDGRIDSERPAVQRSVGAYRQLLVSQGVLDDLNAPQASISARFTAQDFAQLLGEE